MRGIKAIVGVIGFACATAASAATITVDWDSQIFAPTGARNVGTVTFPGGTTGTDAGRFQGAVTSTSGISTAELIDGAADFFAYCHDLAQTIGDTTYQVSFGASQTMRDFLGAVNSVLGGGPFAWLHPTDSKTAAAIQLGIWEALHTDNFNLATGVVRFSAVQNDVSTLFQQFVDAMAGSPDLDNSLVMVLTSTSKQDVITGRIPPRQLVPEPATLVLLGAGAIALALGRRRRR